MKREKRTTQEKEEQRECPIEGRAIDVVGGGPERPEELQVS